MIEKHIEHQKTNILLAKDSNECFQNFYIRQKNMFLHFKNDMVIYSLFFNLSVSIYMSYIK